MNLQTILKDEQNPTDLLTYNETQSAAVKQPQQLVWPVSLAAGAAESRRSAVGQVAGYGPHETGGGAFSW